MIKYDTLVQEVPVAVDDRADLPENLKGLYVETASIKAILLNKSISTYKERLCILAEELGHYHTSSGNILDQNLLSNRKQEKRARNWAYEKLVPLSAFVQAHKQGIRSRYELADHFGVTEDFLDSAIKHYKEKYGLSVQAGKYTICFEPLGVLELFEE